MEFNQLDQQFDESLERLKRKGPMVKDAYGNSPLAADHFLLKKSWDYFKARVKTLDEQWRKMVQAKETQIVALKKELMESRSRTLELDEENHMLRSLDQNIKKVRADDFVGFARKNEALKMRWEAERDALQRKIEELEMRGARSKQGSDQDRLAIKAREDALREQIATLQKEVSMHGDHERDIQLRWSEYGKEQEDKIAALETRADILKSEVDRRDLLLKQAKETIAGQEKDSQALVQFVAELQRSLREKETEQNHLKTRFDILRQEKDNMKTAWEREQAEWRELWDRGRESWERRK